jgi:hypothetical protein
LRALAVAIAILTVTKAHAAPEPLNKAEIMDVVEHIRFQVLPLCCQYLISAQGITRPVRALPGVGEVICVKFSAREARDLPAHTKVLAFVRSQAGLPGMKPVDADTADCANPELRYFGFSQDLPGIYD